MRMETCAEVLGCSLGKQLSHAGLPARARLLPMLQYRLRQSNRDLKFRIRCNRAADALDDAALEIRFQRSGRCGLVRAHWLFLMGSSLIRTGYCNYNNRGWQVRMS